MTPCVLMMFAILKNYHSLVTKIDSTIAKWYNSTGSGKKIGSLPIQKEI